MYIVIRIHALCSLQMCVQRCVIRYQNVTFLTRYRRPYFKCVVSDVVYWSVWCSDQLDCEPTWICGYVNHLEEM